MKSLISYSLFIWSSDIFAHGIKDKVHSWNWDPYILLGLLTLSLLYFNGVRNHGKTNSLSKTQILYFSLSLIFLTLALISPIDLWSDDLQSWHMIQHMILMVIAAPFFVASNPLYILLWSLPIKLRQTLTPLYKWLYGHGSGYYFLWQPILMWGIFTFTLWIWHLPKLYEAALLNRWIHDFQHLSFFISSCLFWRILLDPIHRFKIGRALGIIYLFTTTLHATLLGVFMTLSPQLWYTFYIKRTDEWNLSALEDQQLAGLIMWMPACLAYVIVTIIIFLAWLKEGDNLKKKIQV